MCWSEAASISMVGIGAVATGVSISKGHPKGIWITLGYFTLMEALQVGGYAVINQCDSTANKGFTLLSYLHIAFQPFFINLFFMELIPAEVKMRIWKWIYGICAASAALMIAQLIPIEAAGKCIIGDALCGLEFCTVDGEWHQAWDIPYNGMLNGFVGWLEGILHIRMSFPSYLIAGFIVPIFYGAWRVVVFHALAGPILAGMLTSDPNEGAAIWCLFSIAIILIALFPPVRRFFIVQSSLFWPKRWGLG